MVFETYLFFPAVMNIRWFVIFSKCFSGHFMLHYFTLFSHLQAIFEVILLRVSQQRDQKKFILGKIATGILVKKVFS